MTAFDRGLALFLLATLLVGAGRAVLGPTAYDRMIAAQFVATSGVAIMLLLSFGLGIPALVDVALIVALFAAVAGAALVRRHLPRDDTP